MHWIPFVILTYLVLLAQTTVGGVLTFSTHSIGLVGPDLAAIVAVFVALQVRSGADAMLAAAILGLGVDLTTGGGVGAPTVIGPMPIAYALAGGGVWRVREAFFADRPMTQALLAMAFAASAHGAWVTMQVLRAGGIAWANYGTMLLQAAALAAYTAVLSPLGCFALGKIRRWFIPATSTRSRRQRR